MKPVTAVSSPISVLAVMFLAVGLPSCGEDQTRHPKVIVLGFDGMDPRLCERLMDAGKLPNLNGMRKAGGYRRLATSIPPQSPVAWASFITGADPGVHGIFDFIHRDPEKQCSPYFSFAETVQSDDGWEVGDHRIPLTFWPFNHKASRTVLHRGGVPFWDYLDEAGVPIWIYDIPTNYPPSPSHHGHMHVLSGMGVPDLPGGYGTYQFFSEETIISKTEEGGMRKPLIFENNAAMATLVGPENTFLKKPVRVGVRFQIYRHPAEATARIELQGRTVVLKEGEWSKWCKIDFELEMPPFLPNIHVNGICRFYLQEVRPNFHLYVTPINIDPSDSGDQNITEPPEFITKIADELGLFYTAGFQEDHKALSNEVFNDEEYRQQADYVLQERMSLLNYAHKQYKDGLLFFYFSSTDLQAHMFWWDSEEKHPVRSVEDARKYHQVVMDVYKRMDEVVGNIAERYGDEATILVMSDHGFCNFRRQFNLNTWLRDNGYIQPADCKSILDIRRRRPVDWSRTKAYGLGLNGLYLNLQGRELYGIIRPDEREALLDEIAEKLLALHDPVNDQPVIARVYRAEEVYSGPLTSTAPDLIIGYHRGYRASWATTLGNITDAVLTDNRSAWSADHCIAADQVPGVIFSNKSILRNRPSLVDVAPTILEAFGIRPPLSMKGGSLFQPDAMTNSDTR